MKPGYWQDINELRNSTQVKGNHCLCYIIYIYYEKKRTILKIHVEIFKITIGPSKHGAIMPTEITCKKIPCYMSESARWWCIGKKPKNRRILMGLCK